MIPRNLIPVLCLLIPRDGKTPIHTKTYMLMLRTAVLTIPKHWNNQKLSTSTWIHQLRSIQTTKHHSATRRSTAAGACRHTDREALCTWKKPNSKALWFHLPDILNRQKKKKVQKVDPWDGDFLQWDMRGRGLVKLFDAPITVVTTQLCTFVRVIGLHTMNYFY